jgi:hypothetical protein
MAPLLDVALPLEVLLALLLPALPAAKDAWPVRRLTARMVPAAGARSWVPPAGWA